MAKTDILPMQVLECSKCGLRYSAPIRQRAWCPERHLTTNKKLLAPPEMVVIWSRSDGGEPPIVKREKVNA